MHAVDICKPFLRSVTEIFTNEIDTGCTVRERETNGREINVARRQKKYSSFYPLFITLLFLTLAWIWFHFTQQGCDAQNIPMTEVYIFHILRCFPILKEPSGCNF